MARFCFSITGNATTYPNRANILSRSEKKLEKLKKKKINREVDTDQSTKQ